MDQGLPTQRLVRLAIRLFPVRLVAMPRFLEPMPQSRELADVRLRGIRGRQRVHEALRIGPHVTLHAEVPRPPLPRLSHLGIALRGPACASRAVRVRRCARIWSITDVWVMKATIRIAWWRVGHASGPTSKIRWRRLAHRRLASVGASLDADAIAGDPPPYGR
jgi:hypothetical protein